MITELILEISQEQMMTVNKKYLILSVILLLLGLLIAFFVQDDLIRPYGGDFLVVILLYSLVRSFFKLSVIKAALGVLLFAYAIEFIQYLELIEILGLQDSRAAVLLFGHVFDWVDMGMYTLGIGMVLLVELICFRH